RTPAARPAIRPWLRDRSPQVRRVELHRTKYGRELLVDCRCVSEMAAFILDAPHALTFYEIILVTKGSGWVWLDADRYRVKPGTLLCTTPGQVRLWETQRLE